MASQTELGKSGNASEAATQVDTLTTDLEKAADDANDAVDVKNTRPGARAGLSLSQFWIVMFG